MCREIFFGHDKYDKYSSVGCSLRTLRFGSAYSAVNGPLKDARLPLAILKDVGQGLLQGGAVKKMQKPQRTQRYSPQRAQRNYSYIRPF